jgi:IS30 family transposase
MSHITEDQRYVIERMRKDGHNMRTIANAIGKNVSTVSRELSRNCDRRSGAYRAGLAQRKSKARKDAKPHSVVFTDEMKQYVRGLLIQKYSPEQIMGKAEQEGVACVSHETIYRWIWARKKARRGTLHTHLRNMGRRYRKRGSAKDSRGIIRGRVDISQRPGEVGDRKRAGDMEIDLVLGKKGALVTMNDRAAGTVHIRKVSSKKADEVAKAAIDALAPLAPILRTMTADNGKEFAGHTLIAKELGLDFYFATPYHSWERGSNENLNGLIRQYIPKGTDINALPDEYITFVENELNNRPRKRFGYLSPNQVFHIITKNEGVAFAS